jgi:hypothetical protein
MENETLEKPKRTRTRTPKPTSPVTESFNWGKREFGIIAKSFESETPEVQNTMIAISGMLQIIKLNLKEQPLVIAYLVKKHLPELGELGVLGNLQLGIDGIGLTGVIEGETLSDLLTSLVDGTNHIPDTNWNTFWHGMFTAIAAPLTQWEKVVIYAPYVYNVLVKPVVK